MNEKIVFNGKTYASLDEMPPKERKAYEAITSAFADRDANGVPDLFEGATKMSAGSAPAKIIYEGKMYESLDELPPEARLKYQAAMAKLDTDGNGIPESKASSGCRPGQSPVPSPIGWLPDCSKRARRSPPVRPRPRSTARQTSSLRASTGAP